VIPYAPSLAMRESTVGVADTWGLTQQANRRPAAGTLSDGSGGAPFDVGLVDSLNNAQVAIHRVAQYAECFLVSGTVVCGDRVCDAVEFNQNGALAETAFIHLGRVPSRKHPAAGFLKRGSGELRIGGESLGVVNRAIDGNPIRFGHGCRQVVVGREYACWDSSGQNMHLAYVGYRTDTSFVPY